MQFQGHSTVLKANNPEYIANGAPDPLHMFVLGYGFRGRWIDSNGAISSWTKFKHIGWGQHAYFLAL